MMNWRDQILKRRLACANEADASAYWAGYEQGYLGRDPRLTQTTQVYNQTLFKIGYNDGVGDHELYELH
jgi:hypothetical protein